MDVVRAAYKLPGVVFSASPRPVGVDHRALRECVRKERCRSRAKRGLTCRQESVGDTLVTILDVAAKAEVITATWTEQLGFDPCPDGYIAGTSYSRQLCATRSRIPECARYRDSSPLGRAPQAMAANSNVIDRPRVAKSRDLLRRIGRALSPEVMNCPLYAFVRSDDTAGALPAWTI